ncbi:hypothetical protein [Butyrivibrio sp. VCD2006]|uniref:hypothetical protein n=1 Tax=Butyrivibrio sp. VCD2006 TaxID=1280664 RepID=UPI0003FDA253|nr:hypothetical protein [Butyrivibrio sp. VCD2006]
MLGKIMKHEFRATWRYFLAIDLITLVIGVIAGIVGYNVAGGIDDIPPALGILLILCLAGYVFVMVSAAVLTTILNVVHYYRSLYTAEGYLTFTLPASTIEILSAKMIVALFWQIIMTICLSASVSFLIGSFFLYGSLHHAYGLQDFYEFCDVFEQALGFYGFFGIIRYFLSVFMQIVLNLMMFFFAISIGQLWQKHKVLGSVVSFFGCRFALGIITFFVNLITGSFGMLFNEVADDPGRYFSHSTIVSLVISILVSVGMYVGCVLITDRKLNLD